MFRALERAKQGYFGEELDVYFDDLTDASERIWDVLETYKEIVEALESSNESVLSHRLNDSLRILTAASVVLLPLTLIASVWGMNVQVPGEGSAGLLLVHHRGDGGPPGRDGPLLPPPRLALAHPESVLDDGRFVEVGGERIHLIERGSGPPLLLVHGFPSNAAAWSAIVPRLEAERSHGRAGHGRLRAVDPPAAAAADR